MIAWQNEETNFVCQAKKEMNLAHYQETSSLQVTQSIKAYQF